MSEQHGKELERDPQSESAEVDKSCKMIYSNSMELIKNLNKLSEKVSFDQFHSHYRFMHQLIYALSVEKLSEDARLTLCNVMYDYVVILLQGE